MLVFASVAEAKTLQFEGSTWTAGDYEDSTARVEIFQGRKALFLQRNTAELDGSDLRDVVIEYEYASSHASGFIGVDFRMNDETASLEQFYTRPHQSGQPDATQYMVMINGVATWQLHAGPNDATATDLTVKEWIKVKIIAIGDRADVFVNDMETPLLHVPNLRYDGGKGKFAVYASDRSWRKDTGAYFSKISVRETTDEDKIVGIPKPVVPLPDGLISQFQVSVPFLEANIDNVFDLSELDSPPNEWQILDVEDNGVANLARTTPIADKKNTVLVRIKINSDKDIHRLLKFGYSDRIRLFVDGKLVFAGNAKWRSRDHRFLGTIALADSIAIHLDKGETEIIAAISESFGGWGFMASLDSREDLEVSPK